LDHLKDINFPTVIKADGLAAGKGVLICQTITEGKKALEEIFVDNAFGSAGNKVVIEDFLEGEEASFIAVVSGEEIIPLATSQDHKAAYDGDKGPNTGGMGAYSPAPIVTDELHKKIMDEVMSPTVKGLIAEGSSYLGFLYAGLMIKDDEINVLEFNCRFGDPETQPIMMRLESSLVELCLAAINNTLGSHQVRWSSNHACGVVIASEGYPGNYEINKEVVINNHSEDDVKLFHAGTKIQDNQLVTSGGRVFCATGTGADLATAQKNAYNLVSKISFEGAVNRKDIGNKGIS
jgi:phosphoribosylamine--glycine ligase